VKVISFTEALKKSQNLVKKENPKEYVSLFEALGRVLAEDIICIKNLPAFDNAAMDGFAFKHNESVETLKIKKTIYAGMSVKPCLGNGECYKIMTGAKVPKDADTIVPFENTDGYDEAEVKIGMSIKKGNALRTKGEERKLGSILFEKGYMLDSSSIAMLSSQGISTIGVYKKISIAVFSTGDELKEPWKKAGDDEIYNVNSSALIALLREHGFNADYCDVIPDNLQESIEYFKNLKKYDCLVTTGGISMGEADFIEEALKANGFKESFHGINIKPGRPTMMGVMQNSLVASMPGNPLAAYVNAFLFLIPALKNLQGFKKTEHRKVLAKNTNEFIVKTGRVNIVLGSYQDGQFSVFGQNKYGSGMITPILKSNAILISNEKDSIIKVGKELKVMVF